MAAALEARYRQFHAEGRLPIRLARKASAPLLLDPHERWLRAEVKLLVVGQETLRWHAGEIRTFHDFSGSTEGVATMRELYRQYRLGRDNPKLNSAFWRGFRTLDGAVNRAVKPASDSALWTNIFKVNVSGSVMTNCTRAEIARIHRAQAGLLRHEIEVLKPDVVVFFTGPRYDCAIRTEFDGVEFRPFGKAPVSTLAILRAPGLPAKTLRSYHPEYLQRSRQFHQISAIARWAKR